MLDAQIEAERIARIINGKDHRARRMGCSERALFDFYGYLQLYKTAAAKYEKYLKKYQRRLIGVYTVGVTAEQIAEDVEAFNKSIAIPCRVAQERR